MYLSIIKVVNWYYICGAGAGVFLSFRCLIRLI